MTYIYIYIPWASVFRDFSSRWENNKTNISITKNSEFLSFLDKASSPLRESYLPRRRVVDLLNLNLLPRHLKFFFFFFNFMKIDFFFFFGGRKSLFFLENLFLFLSWSVLKFSLGINQHKCVCVYIYMMKPKYALNTYKRGKFCYICSLMWVWVKRKTCLVIEMAAFCQI